MSNERAKSIIYDFDNIAARQRELGLDKWAKGPPEEASKGPPYDPATLRWEIRPIDGWIPAVVREFLSDPDQNRSLTSAMFNWRDAPQGPDYWNDLYNRARPWTRQCREWLEVMLWTYPK